MASDGALARAAVAANALSEPTGQVLCDPNSQLRDPGENAHDVEFMKTSRFLVFFFIFKLANPRQCFTYNKF